MIQDYKINAFQKTHSMLLDEPTETLSAAQLKAWWDSAPEELRVAHNGLADFIETYYATKAELSGIQLGQITNGTITEPKLETSLAQKVNGGLVDFLSRQAIINGNFDVWQQGNSFLNPAQAQFTADHIFVTNALDGGVSPNLTHSRLTLAPGELSNSFYAYRLTTDGAGNGNGANALYGVNQRVEHGTRYLAGVGKKVTVSFYARSNIPGKRIGVNLFQTYGSGGAPTGLEVIAGQIITLTNELRLYTVTFDTKTLAGKTFGTNNDDSLHVRISYAWGAAQAATIFGGGTAETFGGAGNVDIVQLQQCAGDFALPFQPKTAAQEFLDSQRYRWIPQGGSIFVRMAYATPNTLVFHVPLPVPLRATPTIRGVVNTDIAVFGISGTAYTAFTASASLNSDGVTVTMTKTGHGIPDAYLEIKPTSGFDAEI